MFKIVIDARHCKGCGLCVAFCPKGAIAMSRSFTKRGVNPAEVVDETACAGCLNCAVMCPDAAVSVFELETSDSRGE
jgi:2-oxoglutarate ferredoxin oxidoreductase subunit delta